MSGATHSFNFVREMLCLKVVEILEEKSEKILLENGLEIVDIEFKKEGKNKILRYYLERLEGRVSLDELGSANKILSDLLDELDLIDEEYILEVSSPGVNRVIKKEKDFIKFMGELIDVKLFSPIEIDKNKFKKINGYLVDYNKDILTVKVDEEDIKIPMKQISKVNLSFKF